MKHVVYVLRVYKVDGYNSPYVPFVTQDHETLQSALDELCKLVVEHNGNVAGRIDIVNR